MDILFVLAGLALLCLGAEFLIRGAVALALRMGITPLVVGLTVVAFGTSSPEIVVGIKAAIDGNGGIAVGSVIGSNICNIGLILAIGALVRPISVQLKLLRKDLPILLGATLLIPLTMIGGTISRIEGSLLLAALVAYLLFNLHESRTAHSPEADREYQDELNRSAFSPWKTGFHLLGGLVGLIAGGRLLLLGGVNLATSVGVSEAVIGLTVVAFGTSLPELATTVMAARRGHGDIAIGNAIGSNLMNLTAVLGISAFVRPLGMSGVERFDIAVMIALTAVLLPLMRSGFVLNRLEGALLLACYGGYIVSTALG
ncbi:MAG: calcium/sodium antiporter [Opitutaceae bacterium]